MKPTLWPALLLPLWLYAEGGSYGSSFDQKALMPDIALIVDASYTQRSIRDEEQEQYQLLDTPYSEFCERNSQNGFNLNYAELTLHSDVDPNFELDGVFHFNTEGVEIEEAYFTSTSLPWYLRLKGGKFKSDFGRINHQHQHLWDFSDAPLVYTAFLSAEGLNNVGLQLQWLAPTPWYMMAGIEVLQTGNGSSFANDSFTDNNNTVSAVNAPALYLAYLKNSIDIDDTTLLLGLSTAWGENKNEAKKFDGTTQIYGIDFLLKSYFNSYSYLSWQSEALYRDIQGRDLQTAQDENYQQSGAYTQLVYAYNRNWRIGGRIDSIFYDSRAAEANTLNNRYTLMGDYSPSEFSRLRLQYAHNSAFEDALGKKQNINTLIFEINLAIGAHGAHAF